MNEQKSFLDSRDNLTMALAGPGLLHGVAASPKRTLQSCFEFLLLCFVIIPDPVEAVYILREMVVCTVLDQPCSSIFVSSFS